MLISLNKIMEMVNIIPTQHQRVSMVMLAFISKHFCARVQPHSAASMTEGS